MEKKRIGLVRVVEVYISQGRTPPRTKIDTEAKKKRCRDDGEDHRR